jgi:hypothetical protein
VSEYKLEVEDVDVLKYAEGSEEAFDQYPAHLIERI